MSPFARALTAYHSGDLSAFFTIARDDGFQQMVPASVFFSDQSFPELESRGLDLCKGRVLDVGAAAGRHSLELMRRGFSVTALDILPEMETILSHRGIKETVISDVFSFSKQRFDSLLMLMNDIGMVGSIERLDQFLSHAHLIVSDGGHVICDSIDVSVTSEPIHVAYREQNIRSGKPPGSQSFIMTYKTLNEPFDWLHIDFFTLSERSKQAGWEPSLICEEADGHYLCVLKKPI